MTVDLKPGDPAADFDLPADGGGRVRLADFKGKALVVYFYPKDDTPGCTKEACSIAADLPKFEKLKAKVFGVSIDSVKSHEKFAKKYKLPFTLLSDEQKKVVGLYDIWQLKKFMGREYMGTLRTSFLIDPKGKIAKIYEKVKPELHAQEVLADLKQAKG